MSQGMSAALHVTIPGSRARSAELPTRFGRIAAELTETFVGDRGAVFGVGMAVHELAENLVKYADGADVALELDIEERVGGEVCCTITARNQASPQQLAEVRRIIGELCDAKEPEVVYRKLMTENAFKSTSGLGLARIRAEGGFESTCDVDGTTLTLRATASWTRPAE